MKIGPRLHTGLQTSEPHVVSAIPDQATPPVDYRCAIIAKYKKKSNYEVVVVLHSFEMADLDPRL